MTELKKIIELSRQLGQDSEIVQAGGGNTSVKVSSGEMYVKASGTTLRKADKQAFVVVNPAEVTAMLNDTGISSLKAQARDILVSQRISELVKPGGSGRPSIETFIHALLDKYVVHVHPVWVNALTCLDCGESTAREIFQDRLEYLWVGYDHPGYPLGILLRDELERYARVNYTLPEIIFLQNHGLIISCGDETRILLLLENIICRLKGFFTESNSRGSLGVEPAEASNIPQITALITEAFKAAEIPPRVFRPAKSTLINSICHMPEAKPFFSNGALYPDQVVYCGEAPLYFSNGDEVNQPEAISALQEFLKKFGCPPKAVIFGNIGVILAGETLNETEAIEETLEAHLKVLSLVQSRGNPQYLYPEDTAYIAHWESEKYRSKLLAGGNL